MAIGVVVGSAVTVDPDDHLAHFYLARQLAECRRVSDSTVSSSYAPY